MDGNIKFRCQEKHSKNFTEPSQSAGVDLNKVSRLSLHVLFEHHAVLAVLARGYLYLVLLKLLAYGCMAKNVVWRSWFLDEERFVLG